MAVKSIYAAFLDLVARKKPAALATIVGLHGSGPQVVGASALFSRAGLIAGTLGGGLLEAKAGRLAAAALEKKQSLFFDLDLRGHFGEADEALCGGAVRVLIDASPAGHKHVFRRMEASLAAGKAGILVTIIESPTGRDLPISRHWITLEKKSRDIQKKPIQLYRDAIKKGLRAPVAITTKAGLMVYVEPHEPPPRLIIVGAGHIGQALCRLGSRLGFRVIVLDDRPAYARSFKLPDADRIFIGPVGRSLARLPLGPDAYVVIVTPGHAKDAEALRACVKRPSAYIGMIGSKNKVRVMRENFLKRRWASAREFDRVSAPVGLPIHSQTVEEIAVSIAAELVLVRRSSSLRTERKEPWFGP
jgi:xanthine dehydrogenase accessory factor